LPSKIHRLRALKRFSTSAWTVEHVHIAHMSQDGRINSHKFFTNIWVLEYVHIMSVNFPGQENMHLKIRYIILDNKTYTHEASALSWKGEHAIKDSVQHSGQ
jgi:hypothetical protein